MGNPILDAQLHSLARHIVKAEVEVTERFGGKLDVPEEVRRLNQRYALVSKEQEHALATDVGLLVEFERNRAVKSVGKLAFARFKVDAITGNTPVGDVTSGFDAPFIKPAS